MTFVGCLILFVLGCLFSCEGKVILLNGTSVTLAPGSTGRIVGSFDDTLEVSSYRLWRFTSSDGNQESLASLIGINGDYTKLTSLYEFAVETPATLVLKNVNISYNGTYEFSLVPSNGVGKSQVVVYIAVTPMVKVDCPSPETVNATDNFTCLCETSGGNPVPDVTWYKGNKKIGETGKGEQILRLINVNRNDTGTYRCEAKSHESAINVTEIELIVNYPPENVKLTLTRNGNSATIECSADGWPSASFKIFFNKTKLVTSNKMHTISEVNSTDVGNYTCVAANILGSKSSDPEYLSLEGPTTQITPTTSTSKTTASQTITSPTAGTDGPTTTSPPSGGPSTGAIIGIIIGVLVLIIIVGVVVYCCKSKEKERGNRANIDPVPGNHYELENEEPGPGDGAYDSVGPVGASSSKSKPPAGNTLPPVYAAVDKNNRQGNTLYASLDTEALQTSRASKKEPDRPPQAEYASIDFGKSAPKADLV